MIWLAIAAGSILGLVAIAALLLVFTARRSEAGIPTSRLGRLLRVGLGSMGMATRLLWRRLAGIALGKKRRAERERAERERMARAATEAMGNMKGVYMKLGQIVSFMDETMPPEVLKHLRSLQSQAPPMSYEAVARVIEDELGAPPEAVFAELSREPMAAASIGQVHRGLLRTGEAVAVKVQYPGVGEAIRADLANLSFFIGAIGAITPTLDAGPIAEELRDRLLEELDYQREADSQEEFRRIFAGDDDICIPRVFPRYCSRRVLVTELAEGLGFYRFLEVAGTDARRRAALSIRKFVFDSIWHHRLFNGDPHPGNYLIDEDGRVTFLDFGCVKRFDPSFIERFKALNRAYIEGDRDRYYDVAREMNFILAGKEGKASRDWLWDFTHWFYQPILVDEPFAIDAEYCRRSVSQVFGDNMRKVNMPSEYLMLNRITFGFNSIMAKLGACENWRRLSLQYYYDDGVPPELLEKSA